MPGNPWDNDPTVGTLTAAQSPGGAAPWDNDPTVGALHPDAISPEQQAALDALKAPSEIEAFRRPPPQVEAFPKETAAPDMARVSRAAANIASGDQSKVAKYTAPVEMLNETVKALAAHSPLEAAKERLGYDVPQAAPDEIARREDQIRQEVGDYNASRPMAGEYLPEASRTKSLASGAGNMASLGQFDRLVALYHMADGVDYDEARRRARDDIRASSEMFPTSHVAGQGVGMFFGPEAKVAEGTLALAKPAVELAGKAGGKVGAFLAKVGAGGAAGATSGATYGATTGADEAALMEGRDGPSLADRADAAGEMATYGTAFGAGAPVIEKVGGATINAGRKLFRGPPPGRAPSSAPGMGAAPASGGPGMSVTLPNMTQPARTAGPPLTLASTPVPPNSVSQDFANLHPKARSAFTRLMVNSGVPESEIPHILRDLDDIAKTDPARAHSVMTELMRMHGGQYEDIPENLTATVREMAQTAPKKRTDQTRRIVNNNIREHLGAQGPELTATAERNFGPGAVPTGEAIDAEVEALGKRYRALLDPARPYGRTTAPAKRAAIDKARAALTNHLLQDHVLSDIPAWMQRDIQHTMDDEIAKLNLSPGERSMQPQTWEETIRMYPTKVGHLLQSAYARAARETRDAAEKNGGRMNAEEAAFVRDMNKRRGTSPIRSNAANPRNRGGGLLKLLEDAVPGYRNTRQMFGSEMGARDALSLPRRFLSIANDDEKRAQFLADLDELSPAQFRAAKAQITSIVNNELGRKIESPSLPEIGRGEAGVSTANLQRLSQAGVLHTLEEAFGADGKRLADAIRHARATTETLTNIHPKFNSRTILNSEDVKNAPSLYEDPKAGTGNLVDATSQLLGVAGITSATLGRFDAAVAALGGGAVKLAWNAWKNSKKLSPAQRSELAEFLTKVRRGGQAGADLPPIEATPLPPPGGVAPSGPPSSSSSVKALPAPAKPTRMGFSIPNNGVTGAAVGGAAGFAAPVSDDPNDPRSELEKRGTNALISAALFGAGERGVRSRLAARAARRLDEMTGHLAGPSADMTDAQLREMGLHLEEIADLRAHATPKPAPDTTPRASIFGRGKKPPGGGGEIDLFHGTPEKFEGDFDFDKAGTNMHVGRGSKNPAIWFTSDEGLAKQYGENVISAKGSGRVKTIEANGRPLEALAGGHDRIDKWLDAQFSKAKAEGFDGVRFSKLSDAADDDSPAHIADVFAMLNRGSVRRVDRPATPPPTDKSGGANLSGVERLKRGLPMTEEDASDWSALLYKHEQQDPKQLAELMGLRPGTPTNVIRDMAKRTFDEAKSVKLDKFKAEARTNNQELADEITRLRKSGKTDAEIEEQLGLDPGGAEHFVKTRPTDQQYKPPKPPPVQSSMFGGGGKGKGPPTTALPPRVIAALNKTRETLPPTARNALAINAGLPIGARRAAADVHPAILAMAGPFTGAKTKAPTALDTGVRDKVGRLMGPRGGADTPELERSAQGVATAQRAWRAADGDIRKWTDNWSRTNAWNDDTIAPVPAAMQARLKQATEDLIAARALHATQKLDLLGDPQQKAWARQVLKEVDDAARGGTKTTGAPVQTKTGQLVGGGNGLKPGQRPAPSSREAKEVARLLFTPEGAKQLAGLLDGSIEAKPYSTLHLAGLWVRENPKLWVKENPRKAAALAGAVAASAAGYVAVGSDLSGRIDKARDQREAEKRARTPVPDPRLYDNPTRNSHDPRRVREIQSMINVIDPRFRLMEDGAMIRRDGKDSDTQKAVRYIQDQHGLEPTGLLDEQTIDLIERLQREALIAKSRQAPATLSPSP